MTPDLWGRWQTRIAFTAFGVLPSIFVLQGLWGFAATPMIALLMGVYALALGLVMDGVYHLAQKVRREGDWPLGFSVYGLAMELLALFGLVQTGLLPGIPACLREVPDLALRRMICPVRPVDPGDMIRLFVVLALVQILCLAVILPVLAPFWRWRRWRLVSWRRRRAP